MAPGGLGGLDGEALMEMWRRVVRELRREGLGDDDAEDVAQVVLIGYWLHRQEVRRPRAYLCQAARNRAASLWARLGREKRLPMWEVEDDRWQPVHPALRWEDRVDEDVAAEQELGGVVAALGEASRSDRLLAWLYWVVGAASEAVGSVMGMSGDWTRVRALRLRRRLMGPAAI